LASGQIIGAIERTSGRPGGLRQAISMVYASANWRPEYSSMLPLRMVVFPPGFFFDLLDAMSCLPRTSSLARWC
jgi:hypothetical protein